MQAWQKKSKKRFQTLYIWETDKKHICIPHPEATKRKRGKDERDGVQNPKPGQFLSTKAHDIYYTTSNGLIKSDTSQPEIVL